MDGYGTPEQHVARAVELGLPALALTEHGNVSSHVRLEKAALKSGIKPIFGVELYTGGVDEETRSKYKWHLTVLAENQEGYRNLLRLVSRGWAEGFHYEPTVSGEMLAEHQEGLIVLSGCSGSKLACDLLGGKGKPAEEGSLREAERTAAKFRALLGDRYYLELQSFPELERTKAQNQAYAEIGKRLGIPLVATGDVHYPKPDDNEMQVILHAAGRGKNTFEQQSQGWGYDVRLTMHEDAEIARRIAATGLTGALADAAVANAAEIAQRCNVMLPKVDRIRYPCPDGDSSAVLFRKWLRRGWNFRKIDQMPNRREYVERIKYEMALIESKDFVDYFLMLSDVVRAVKDDGVPVGPARGSAAASLACYLLRITEVNPLLYPNMLFERFIDVNRMDLPDIDLDFDDELRDKARQHLIMRYGEDRVGNIGTFTRYRGKNSIDDVARVFRVPKAATDEVKDYLIERSGGDSRFDATLEDTLEQFPQTKVVFDKHPDLYHSLRLEGMLKGMGVHAAGLVVSNGPLTDTCAIYTRTTGKDKRTVSVLSVDKYDADYIGVLKIDALSLATMGMIRIALEAIGMPLQSLYDIPMDDPETMAAFRRNDVVGIFQFEGRATKSVNGEVKPDNFNELCDINALSRPGPLHSGSTADYISVKHGHKPAEHLHPIVDELTASSQFQIIYQEQILSIVRRIGQFPWTDAGEIRKVISQKKGEAAFNRLEGKFIDGAATIGVNREQALKIWRRLVTAGTYAFNAAHCVSYSMLAFWCMWLKVHHPEAFYMAQLRKSSDEQWPGLLRDMLKHGVPLLPADINESQTTWTADSTIHGVRPGLQQIPGIGEKVADVILTAREETGGFDDWDDLLKIKGIGPSKMALIKGFAEQEDPFGLEVLGKAINQVREQIRSGELSLPQPNYTAAEVPYEAKYHNVTWLGVVKARNPRDLFEEHRSRTGEELDPKTVKRPDLKDSMMMYCEDDTGEINVKLDRFKYPRFKDAAWGLRPGKDLVLVQGYKRAQFGRVINITALTVIDPDED